MQESLAARVTAALAAISNPRLENDILSAGMVRDLEVSEEGVVQFTFLLGRDDPATLVRQVRTTLREIEGVGEVRISVTDPGAPPAPKRGPAGGAVPPHPRQRNTGISARSWPSPVARAG